MTPGRLLPWLGPVAVLLAQAPIPDRAAACLGLIASFLGLPLAAWPLLRRFAWPASATRNPAAGLILAVAVGAVLIPLPHLLLMSLGFAGVPLSILSVLLVVVTAAVSAVSSRVSGAAAKPLASGGGASGQGNRRAAIVAALILTLLMALRIGTPLGPFDDALDHLATIRHLVESDRVEFPGAFYGPGESEGLDIRKGVTHLALASAAVVARVDPSIVWEASSTLLAPLSMAAFLSLVMALTNGFGPGVWMALPALLFLAGDPTWIFKSAYGGHAGLALAWAIIAGFLAGWGARWALLAGAAAAAVHAYAPVQVIAPLLGYRLFMVFPGDRNGPQGTVGPAIPSTVGLGAFCLGALPVEAARLFLSAASDNPLHGQSMAWLQLGPGPIASPIQLIGWFGLAGLLALPLALLFVLIDHRRSHRYLAATVLVPASLLFNPWLLAPVGRELGSVANKLALVWSPALAFVLLATAVIQSGSRRWARLAAGGVIAIMLLVGASSFRSGLDRLTRTGEVGPESLPPGVALAIDRLLPLDAVIASDPITSYAIPAMTGRRVMVTLHQHAPPGDSRALERLRVAAALLSTCVPIEEALAGCIKEGAGWLVINPISPRRIDEFGAHRDPRNNHALAARFQPLPGWMDSVAVVGDFRIYRLGAGRRTGPAFGSRGLTPGVAPDKDAVHVSTPGAELAVESLPSNLRVKRGEPMILPASWRFGDLGGRRVWPVDYREFEAHLRFEHEDVDRLGAPGPFSKLHRRLLDEPRLGGSLRARGVEMPFCGLCSPEDCPAGIWLLDSLQVIVPQQIITGRYRLELSLDEVGLYPVLTLADLFSDEDRHEGPEVGWMTVE
ncbi:MAG: hypothetical protein SGI90_02895 [Candidatus Eisenbacteria bacterium]|nr:hypothetical protein [Candidatus Eisenbacteria bacterium]